MLPEWVAGKCAVKKKTQKNIHIYSVSCQKKVAFSWFLSCSVCLQEEFDTLKPWYDHIGGDAIGLTWNKHNSKVKQVIKKASVVLLQTKEKRKIKTNVMFWLQKRERDEEEEESNPMEMLKAVGEMGKGLVRDIYLLKPPRLV